MEKAVELLQSQIVKTLEEFHRRGIKVDKSTLQGAVQIQSEIKAGLDTGINRQLLEMAFDGEVRFEFTNNDLVVVRK